jgi:hypothetical protein
MSEHGGSEFMNDICQQILSRAKRLGECVQCARQVLSGNLRLRMRATMRCFRKTISCYHLMKIVYNFSVLMEARRPEDPRLVEALPPFGRVEGRNWGKLCARVGGSIIV